MANTRMTAPNTFTKGLVMDFNPTVTKADCLVNALNATLLTFNGNEMQLQQDMGNGRVETAYLPEGYIPVGACEFGDIIYIVSYNPLENKSQIGCFPSPERNITSDEITDLKQNLVTGDFQQLQGSTPTGVIRSMSVKKIVYGNKNMNPGDKFIIYEEAASNQSVLQENKGTLSDFGNSLHTHNEWPKLLKLKVVSIEDSGRIVDLNAAVKWYDNDYYLTHLQKQPASTKPDIDSYRSLVSSAYSIFQSKVSGKLAILAELESIEGFSCTYDVYTSIDPNTNETTYRVYFYTAWETGHNDVNPLGFIFTKSEWSKDLGGGFIFMPQVSKDGTSVEYVKSTVQTRVPVDSAATIDGTGTVTGYDFSQVKHYTRTYELENPSSTFETYIEKDSYNAKITNILDWHKVGNSYTAVANQADYKNLRPVTRITRLLDVASGEPVLTGDMYQYLYNLDSYEMVDNKVTYMTKGINGEIVPVVPTALKDDVVNNYFHKDVPTLVTGDFKLPQKKVLTIKDVKVPVDTDLSRMIWNYAVAPVMPYGVLDHLEIAGNIDFSKLGTGLIDLIAWRYYNSGNVSTLTWGLDAYAEPNKGIAEVVFDFFDNQGCAASYHIAGKTSYAGTFTEQIVLDQQNSSYRLNSVDAQGKSYIHAGVEDPEGTVYLTSGNKPTTAKTAYGPYKNDAGTLYPNILYLVKITVKYCPKDIIGNFNTDNTSGYKTFYRWYWTNELFNEMYYNTADFKTLQPRLGLDFSATFNTKGSKGTNTLTPKQYIYMGTDEFLYSEDKDELYKTLGANVYAINQNYEDDANGNIRLTLDPGLSEGFNTFNLNKDKLDLISDLYVKMGKSTITKSIDAPSTIHTGDSFTSPLDDSIQPIVAPSLCSHETATSFDRSGYAGYNYGTNNCTVSDTLLKLIQEVETPNRKTASYTETMQTPIGGNDIEIYSSQSAYESYLDSFSLNLLGATLKRGEALMYYDSEGKQQTLDHYQYRKISLADAGEEGPGIRLVLAGTAYSKMYASEMAKDSTSKVLRSIIHNASPDKEYSSLKSAGLHYYNGHLYFNDVITWHMGESGGKSTRWGSYHSKGITTDTWRGTDIGGDANSSNSEWRPDFTDGQVQELWKKQLTSALAGFMICRSTSSNGKIDRVDSNVSWDKIRSAFGLPRIGNRITNSRGETTPQDPNDWTSNECSYIHSFMVYDQRQNIVIPVADYFVSSGSPVTQKKRSGYSVPTTTLADMLGSMFAQLYVVDTSTKGDNGLLGNFVSLQQFSEYWNKDIIIKVDTDTDTLNNQDNLHELITIQTQTMAKYLSCLKANTGQAYAEDEIDLSNVTIVLYGAQRVFSFKFEVPYALGNLTYLNNQRSEPKNKIMLTTLDDKGQPQTGSFSGNVIPNTLYTWTGTNIVQFGQGTTMYYATSFSTQDGELYMTASRTTLKSGSFATLSKVLQYDGGEISWHNLSQFSTWNSRYNLQYRGTGDDPYLRDLPIVSFFNLYKPGS